MPNSQNIPLALSEQCTGGSYDRCTRQRRYTKSKFIETLAVQKYKQNGRGVSFSDLFLDGFASHKHQAQTTLKHCLRSDILFTIANHKPQEYYPACLKSEILKKNIPIEPTGVEFSKLLPFQGTGSRMRPTGSYQGIGHTIAQTLEGHVLPLLPQTPSYIHRMQFRVSIPHEYYHDIARPVAPWNKGKEHEIIGSTHAKYRFYANGTVVVSTECSNNPFRLESDTDCSSIMAFLGQLRDRLVLLLADKHERIVPDIMSWELTQWDLNKDVQVGDWAQITGTKIQIRHACHLFRVYIKSKGKDTICRVEEANSSKSKSAIEVINNIFNPTERLEKQIEDLNKKLEQILVFCNNNAGGSTNLDHNISKRVDEEFTKRLP